MDHIKVTTTFENVPGSDLMMTRQIFEPKPANETEQQFADRTWKQKVHYDEADGRVFIQPFAVKNALESAGKWLGEKIKGEGKKTYTDRFRKGVLVVDRLYLQDKKDRYLLVDDFKLNRMSVPVDGVHGRTGKRVVRIFPTMQEWKTTSTIYILDNKITEDVLLRHLEAIGNFIGFGAMRIENGGINGRFVVTDLKFG